MPSPFSIAAPELRQNGYSVIPLHPVSKRPLIENWTEFGVNHADEATFLRWMKWNSCNIGVCLGVASNLVAIDLDNDIAGLHAQIEACLPPTPVFKIGAKGKTLFYQFNGQRSQGFSKDGKRVLDILSQGRQTVLPPSVHPDIYCAECKTAYEVKHHQCPHCGCTQLGNEQHPIYNWGNDESLRNTPTEALPHMPASSTYDISKLFTPEVHHVEPRLIRVYDDTKMQEVQDAISHIPADDYEMWVKIGMCMKDKFGDQAFEAWDAWSATSSKYKSAGMRTKWNSFRNTGVTISSLFYMAMDYGFTSLPQDFLDPVNDEIIINGFRTGSHRAAASPSSPSPIPAQPKSEKVEAKDVPPQDEIKKTDTMLFPPDLFNAPGLVGRIATLINRTSLLPQPILALGGAIAAAGTLMGRKVRSDTGLRTNFYVIGLAPSGSGKDHGRTIIKRMLHDSGLGDLELGVPASSAGLVSGLRERGKGRGIVLWDEFGRVLKQISGFRAGNHERDIVTAMIELFSSSQSVYLGKSYANHDGKNPVKPIDQPCLSVFGVSVPSHFYDALSGSEAIDGFLSRWMIFESKDYTMEEESPEISFSKTPQDIIDICKYWKEQPFNSEPSGNLGDVQEVSPRLIPCTTAAAAYLKDFSTQMRKCAAQAEMAKEKSSSIYARLGEHARRLALVGHEGDQIELKVAEWAAATAHHCGRYMASAIEDYVSSTELESQTKRVLRCLRDKKSVSDGWVTRAEITRLFQGISLRTRTEILVSLIDRNEVEEDKQSGTGGRAKSRYRAIA